MVNRAETLAKWAAVLAIVCYILGLLTTALYLYQQDVTVGNLATLKPRFAYTGALVLICLTFGALLPFVKWPWTIASSQVTARIFPFAILLAMELVSYIAVLRYGLAHPITGAVWTGVFLSLCAACVGMLVSFSTQIAGNPNTRFALFLTIPTCIAVLVGFVVHFSGRVFPAVPDQFGGAAPKRVQLVFEKDTLAQAQAVGIPVDSNSLKSRPMTILYQDSDYYTLRLDDEQVVQVASRLVVGATVDSKRPSGLSVATRNRGARPGVPEPEDQLVLVYSEPIDATTLLKGWRGEPIDVTLRISILPNLNQGEVTVWDTSTIPVPVALGLVELSFEDLDPTARSAEQPAEMTRDGATIAITLKSPVVLAPPPVPTLLIWRVNDQCTDLAGNPCARKTVEESGDGEPGKRPEF